MPLAQCSHPTCVLDIKSGGEPPPPPKKKKKLVCRWQEKPWAKKCGKGSPLTKLVCLWLGMASFALQSHVWLNPRPPASGSHYFWAKTKPTKSSKREPQGGGGGDAVPANGQMFPSSPGDFRLKLSNRVYWAFTVLIDWRRDVILQTLTEPVRVGTTSKCFAFCGWECWHLTISWSGPSTANFKRIQLARFAFRCDICVFLYKNLKLRFADLGGSVTHRHAYGLQRWQRSNRRVWNRSQGQRLQEARVLNVDFLSQNMKPDFFWLRFHRWRSVLLVDPPPRLSGKGESAGLHGVDRWRSEAAKSALSLFPNVRSEAK